MKDNRSRTFNSFRNVTVAVICQTATLLISFISRRFFVKILGSDYLGIGGLFQNVLSILSLADLGFASAISYTLYKPIAENDREKISAIVRFYGRIYLIVAGVILCAGVALIPFIDLLVSSEISIADTRLYYVLYLTETVGSYLFVYKSVLITADQRKYVTNVIHTAVTLAASIAKLIVLYFTKSFTAYLAVQIIGVIASNLAVSKKAEKDYPYLLTDKNELESSEKKKIFSDVRSLFAYKIGHVILYHTDSILISLLVSTTVVGFYSNYTLLTGTVMTFSELIFGALGASIGNLKETSDRQRMSDTFDTVNFVSFFVYGFCSVCLFCMMDDFVGMFFGEKYVLGTLTAFIISFNVFIPGMQSSVMHFRQALGMFRQTKYVYLITSALNLVLSVILGKFFGLNGILMATGIARILTNVWYEPYVLMKKYFEKSYLRYLLRLGIYYALFILSCAAVYLIKRRFFTPSFWGFVAELVVCVFGTAAVYCAIFARTREFRDIVGRSVSILEKLGLKRPKNKN